MRFQGRPARRRRPSTWPAVQIVIRSCAKAKAERSKRTSMAAKTSSALSSGSPMPMNTILWKRHPSLSRAVSTCAIISPAPRDLTSPWPPVSQNAQPIRQPTCEETQSVALPSSGPRTAIGMRTHSTARPSSRRNRTLAVAPNSPASSTTRSGERVETRKASSQAEDLAAPRPRVAGSRWPVLNTEA